MRKIILGFIIIYVLLCGCGADNNPLMEEQKESKQYTAEELGNLAQLEIYSGKNELLNVINQEEILYQFNQCLNYDSLGSEEQQKELEKSVEELKEQYTIISYKYPAALISDQALEKNITIIIYEDSNIIKMEASEESIKNINISQEFLTFYYKASEEDMKFYHSLFEE